jgi:hypothetical protein
LPRADNAALAMTDHDYDKRPRQIGKRQRHHQKRRPLTLPSPARGEGKTTTTTKTILVSGLPRGDKAPLAMTQLLIRKRPLTVFASQTVLSLKGRGNNDHGKVVNGIIRNGDPSPCFALRNRPLPQGARERQRQSGKRHT